MSEQSTDEASGGLVQSAVGISLSFWLLIGLTLAFVATVVDVLFVAYVSGSELVMPIAFTSIGPFPFFYPVTPGGAIATAPTLVLFIVFIFQIVRGEILHDA